MSMFYARKLLSVAGFVFISSISYAASNPASTSYFDHAISSARLLDKLIAGDGVLIHGNTISTTPFLKIGDFYQGGVVFYVDDTGRHGLSVSLNDLANAAYLSGCSGTTCPLVGATANGIGAGRSNSTLMIARQMILDSSATPNVAQLAASLFVEASTGNDDNGLCSPTQPDGNLPTICIGGWYIPSMNEFSLLGEQMKVGSIDATLAAYGGTKLVEKFSYWQSSESSTLFTYDAYGLQYHPDLSPAIRFDIEQKSEINRARAIRQF